MPILSKPEIDAIAENFISDFNPEAMEKPMEIDIDSFALNYLSLKQDFQYLSHNGIYLGMTVFNDTNKVPVYVPETNTAEYVSAKARTVIDNNLLEEDQEYRYRYTMDHEGGHDILHRPYFSYDPNQISFFDADVAEPLIQCRAIPLNGKVKPVSQWNDKDSMEWQANYLSSALLMPKAMVFKLINSLSYQQDILRSYTYVHGVSNTFNVSWQAAVNRLRCLGIIKENVPSESTILDFMPYL